MVTTDDFLSGTSGEVSGLRRTSKALVSDALADGVAVASLRSARIRRASSAWPVRRVLVLAIERPAQRRLLARARAELSRSRHEVRFVSTPIGDRGKFENLNRMLREAPAAGHDWLLVVDDDVVLPKGFLDAFVFLAERFELDLAQPAHRYRSHAAWEVTRRRPGSVVRETGFVEIGPVTGFHSSTLDALLPFPELRVGWGLDTHWSALAAEHGWRMGVIDATPVLHAAQPVAASYDRQAAIDEARAFLADRPYTPAAQAARTLTEHRSWR
jgi:hypothetical protein